MASVPNSQGVPSVEPDVGSPDDYQRIQPTGLEAIEKLGETAQRASEQIYRTATFFDEVAGDDAFNQLEKSGNNILHGDPTKVTGTGPDGKPMYDTGYFGLQGRAALDARAGVEKQLDTLLDQTRAGLSTPRQRFAFEQYSRRWRAMVGGQIGEYADRQSQPYFRSVNQATADNGLARVARSPMDDAEFSGGMGDIVGAKIKQAELEGATKGDPLWRQAAVEGRRAAISARIGALTASDDPEYLKRAQTILDDPATRGALGESYAKIYDEVQGKIDNRTGAAAASQAIGGARKAQEEGTGVPNLVPGTPGGPKTAAEADQKAADFYAPKKPLPAIDYPWKGLSKSRQAELLAQGYQAPSDPNKGPVVPAAPSAATPAPKAPQPMPAEPYKGFGAAVDAFISGDKAKADKIFGEAPGLGNAFTSTGVIHEIIQANPDLVSTGGSDKAKAKAAAPIIDYFNKLPDEYVLKAAKAFEGDKSFMKNMDDFSPTIRPAVEARIQKARAAATAAPAAAEKPVSTEPLPAQKSGEVNAGVWKATDANARAVDAMNYLMKSNGDSKLMAAARAGTMIGESGMNPTVLGPSGDYGLFQMMGGRKSALMGTANYTDPYVQMDFSNREMKTSESAAYRELQAAKTPFEATVAMLDYERPGWWLAAGRNPAVGSRNPSFRQRLAATTALLNGQSLGKMIVPGGTNVMRAGGDYRYSRAVGGHWTRTPATATEAAVTAMATGTPAAASNDNATATTVTTVSPPAPSAAAVVPAIAPVAGPSGTPAVAAAPPTEEAAAAQPAAPPIAVPVAVGGGGTEDQGPVWLKQDAYDRIRAMNLRPEAEQRAFESVNRQIAAEEVAAGATERQRKLVNDQAADEITKLIAGGQITPGLLHRIDTDPRITDFHTRMALHEWAMKDPESWDAMSLRGGPGFAKAWSDIIAPSGQPDRITDKSALYRLAQDKDLSPWGLQYLSKMMDDVRKDPDRAALNEQMSAIFRKAKDYLTFDQTEDQTVPAEARMKDPQGVQLYNSFVWQFLHGLDAWEKGTAGRGGKDPRDYVTLENAQKMYTTMRSPREKLLAQLTASGDVSQETAAAVPAPPAGIDKSGWTILITHTPPRADGKPMDPTKWQTALTMLAGRPTPEVVRQFDQKFGPLGLHADGVLDFLGVSPITEGEAKERGAAMPPGAAPAPPVQPRAVAPAAAPAPAAEAPPSEPFRRMMEATPEKALKESGPAPTAPPVSSATAERNLRIEGLYRDTLIKRGIAPADADRMTQQYMRETFGVTVH